MSIRISAKKAAVAAIMVAPLVLAACGSDDEDTTASSTTKQTSSSTTTTTKVTGENTSEEDTQGETTEDEATEQAPEQDAQEPAPTSEPVVQQPAPQQNVPVEPVITYQSLAPVEGGGAASPEDAAAIESLVRGSLQQTTLRSMLEYVPRNTCSRVIEANGGAAALDFSTIPDVPLNQIPGADPGTVDSITDIQVDGNSASAWVVASANGQTDSGTQRFLNEGGQWKFCD